MPIEYSSSGIITQNISEILDEREQNLKLIMGEDFVIEKDDPIGNMELADAKSELSIHELLAWLIPNQLDANTATGIFLETICEKNRIYRKQPKYTTMNFILKGTKKSSFTSGGVTVSDSLTGIYYDLNEDCVIGEDGTVSAEFICQEYGENYPLLTSTLNILTPVVGLDSVVIDEDNPNIVVGRYTETDEELRRRRQLSVGQNSSTIVEGISSSIYSLDGVNFLRYFENDTESTDSNGLPMKSFEYVVDGGDEDEIIDVIFLNKPLGTYAYGTTSKTKTDSDGNVYEIGYTKAENVFVGFNIALKTSVVQSESWKNKVKDAIIEKFNEIQSIGATVKDYNYITVLTGFSEISDIVSIKIYDMAKPSVTYTQMPIGNKQIAKIEASNINFTISVG